MFIQLLAEAAPTLDPSITSMIPLAVFKWVAIILGAAKVAEIIVKLTPNKIDNKILAIILPILKFVSLNAPDVEEVKKTEKPKK